MAVAHRANAKRGREGKCREGGDDTMKPLDSRTPKPENMIRESEGKWVVQLT